MRHLGKLDINKLEQQYLKLIEEQDDEILDLRLKDDSSSPGNKTFFVQPGNLLVDYDDNLMNTEPRPGIPGLWASGERWIYR